MSETLKMEISDSSLEAIKHALRMAKAIAEMDYEKADYEYDKERMSRIRQRLDAIEKAQVELP